MATIKISAQKSGKVSKPMLIHVDKIIFESTSKQQQIIYYRIPFTFKYQSIEKLKDSDLFLPDCSISYKVINYVKKTQEIVQSQSQIEIKNKDIKLTNKTKEGFIQIHGIILNQADESDTFADISLKDIQGYEKYYEYRKKYKTLQNITRKINFSLDHRLKLICEKPNFRQQFFFSLDELKNKQLKNWYLQLTQKTKLQFQFQQIVSIGDTNIEKNIQEGCFDIGELSIDSSYNLVLEMSQYLKIALSMKIVKNKNISKFQFASLRVFETSQTNKILKIGNEETINSSSSAIQVQPLLEGKFYDFQYGYLSQNLYQFKKMGQQQKMHQYLEKLTSSKEKYQNFINQKVFDLSQSKNLIFAISNDIIQVPVAYILEGYNCFSNQNWSVKFLLEVKETNANKRQEKNEEVKYQKFQAIPRKLFDLRIKDMLNIGQLATIIQKNLVSNEKSFYFKINCQSTIYTIEFQISIVKRNEFKKQSKQLEIKTEYSEFIDEKFVLLKQSDDLENLFMIKSANIQPFYLIEMTDSSNLTFNFSTKKHVIMYGQISKSQIYQSGSEFDKMIILSPIKHGNSQQKSVVSLQFRQIPQKIEGSSFNFKVKYSLITSKLPSISSSIYFGLQILRIQEEDSKKQKKRNDKNKLEQKVQLLIQDTQSQTHKIKEFSTNRSCFVQKNSNLKMEIKLKKMNYDVDLNIFDNSSLIEKTLLLNRNLKDTVKQGTLTLQLPAHHFRQFEFDSYDQHINQKVTLKLEIYCSKEPFSTGDQHVYRVKVPHLLWKMNNLQRSNQSQPNIEMQSYLSRKDKKTEPRQIIFNSAQEVSLPHFNYSDGISIKIKYQDQFEDIGYSKIRDCIKAKYQVIKDQLRWNEDSQWYLASVTLSNSTFYFLIKMQFDPNIERQSSNSSRATQKTKSKQKKQTSNQKGGPDIFAKTLKSQDVITKLKVTKNNLNEELRKLTSKYVQSQSMITYLKKKIAQTDEQNRRKKQELQSALQSTNNKPKNKVKNSQKFKNSTYQTVCECGQRDNVQWGYCVKCIQKLRQKYETFFKQYQQNSLEYEKAMFKKFSLRGKIDKLKQKIQGYRNIMKGNDSIQHVSSTPLQIENAYQKMQQKQLTLQLEQLKLQIFDLERERQSQFERRSYQMNQLERKIKKQEDELWEKSQQLNALNLKLKEVQQQIKQNQKVNNQNFE